MENNVHKKSKSLSIIKQTKTSMIRMLKANPSMIPNSDLPELVPDSEIKNYDLYVDFYLKKIATKPMQKRQLYFDLCTSEAPSSEHTSMSSSKDQLNNIQSINENLGNEFKQPSSKQNQISNNKNFPSSNVKKLNGKTNSFKKSAVLNKQICDKKMQNKEMHQPSTRSKDEVKVNFIKKNMTATKHSTYNKISESSDKNVAGRCENHPKISIACKSTNTSNIKPFQTSKSHFDISARNYKRRSRSQDSFLVPKSGLVNELSTENNVSSNKSNNRKHTVQFKTPITDNRQSVSFATPKASQFQRPTSTPFLLRQNKTPIDLKRRLDNWIKLKGKSLTSYHHLKCFDLNQQLSVENKENIEVINVRSESYEQLNIRVEEEQNDTEDYVKNLIILQQVARDALDDLHKLILEGYSLESCNAWLSLIRDKYHEIENEPQYWECRAAIEQMQGNISSAITFYRTAIVQGAEVNKVDQSLEQLLQKFSLLNISINSPSANEDVQAKKKKQEKNLSDVRAVFKSTIIQFAIQERTIKKDQAETKQFVVTPVRRSTRQSLSKYKKNPDVHICSSLHNYHSENVQFCCNKDLCVRYQHE